MQIGPRIRVGGSVGKFGQKAKIGIGKVASKAAPVVAFFNPALGAAVGAAGDILDTSEGGFDIGRAAMNAGKTYAFGKVAGKLKSGLGSLRGANYGIGDVAKGAAMELKEAVTDPSRFRSISAGLMPGGSGGDKLRTLMDLGKAGEGIYDRYQQNQDRNMAQREYENAAPLRQAAQAGLLDTSRPDVSSIFADPNATQGRYRRVTVGSRGY